MNQVYICHTVFHLFVVLIKALTQQNKDIYVFVPDFLKFKPNVFIGKGIKGVIVYSYVSIDKDWSNYKKSHPFSVLSYKAKLSNIIEATFNIEAYDSVFKTSDIYVFNDGSPFVAYLMLRYRKNHFTLIEDGEAIYTKLRIDTRYFLKKLSGYPLSFGHSSIINTIEVRFPERLASGVRKKAKVLPFEEIKNQLSDNQKSDLLSFFNVEQVNCVDERPSLLLLTQPLSEDGIVDESYKINLYKEILTEYIDDYQIIIKAHPRELTNYSNFLPNAILLSRDSPVELLSFFDFKLTKAITLFSTSIHSIPAHEKVFLGLDYDFKVKQSWMRYMGVKNVIK